MNLYIYKFKSPYNLKITKKSIYPNSIQVELGVLESRKKSLRAIKLTASENPSQTLHFIICANYWRAQNPSENSSTLQFYWNPSENASEIDMLAHVFEQIDQKSFPEGFWEVFSEFQWNCTVPKVLPIIHLRIIPSFGRAIELAPSISWLARSFTPL